MKTNFHFILLLLLISTFSSCRFTSYTPTSYLGKSLLELEGKKVLILEVESNLKYSKREVYAIKLYQSLLPCHNTEVLDMTNFYNQYQIGFVAAQTMKDKLLLLEQYTDIDYVMLPYASIQSNDLMSISSDEAQIGIGQNAALAGIETFDVSTQLLVKYNQYRGKVDNSGESDFDYEFYQSANKIVRKCYDKSLNDFLRYISCGNK